MKKILVGFVMAMVIVTGIFPRTIVPVAHAQTGIASTAASAATGNDNASAQLQQKLDASASPNTEPTNPFSCEKILQANFGACFLYLLSLLGDGLQLISIACAKILDFFIKFSISSQTYKQGDSFIQSAWTIIRDIGNIVFIFVLMYMAIMTLLGKGNWKKTFVNVFIAALLVNFSLFFTRVIIDVGNATAWVIYGQMNVTRIDANGNNIPGIGPAGEKEIALALASVGTPQNIYKNVTGDPGSRLTDLALLLMILATNGFLIFIFLTSIGIFITRVIQLWLQMIFSPLAFISLIIPSGVIKGGGGFDFSLKKWLEDTAKLSFIVPIFLFFFYIAILFEHAANFAYNPVPPLGNDATEWLYFRITSVLAIFIKYLIILGILNAGKELSKKLASAGISIIGKLTSDVTSAVVGAALTAATGGTAKFASTALKGTVGRFGARAAAETKGRQDILSRGIRSVGSGLASTEFDYRATDAFKRAQGLFKKEGIEFSGGVKTYGLAMSEKGYTGMQERGEKRWKERVEATGQISDRDEVARNVREAKDRFDTARLEDVEYQRLEEQLEKKREAYKKAQEDGDKEEMKKISEEIKQTKADLKNTKTWKAKEDLGAAEKKLKEEILRRKAGAVSAIEDEMKGFFGTIQRIAGEPGFTMTDAAIRRLKDANKPPISTTSTGNTGGGNTGTSGTGTGNQGGGPTAPNPQAVQYAASLAAAAAARGGGLGGNQPRPGNNPQGGGGGAGGASGQGGGNTGRTSGGTSTGGQGTTGNQPNPQPNNQYNQTPDQNLPEPNASAPEASTNNQPPERTPQNPPENQPQNRPAERPLDIGTPVMYQGKRHTIIATSTTRDGRTVYHLANEAGTPITYGGVNDYVGRDSFEIL